MGDLCGREGIFMIGIGLFTLAWLSSLAAALFVERQLAPST
ncbi:MAG: hypothetical protein SNJ59_05245 [Aggregatilineales bacterium]